MIPVLHSVIKGIGPGSPFAGLHRIVWVNEKMDLVVTIEIPTRKPKGASPRYYKGPVQRSYETLALSGEDTVVETHVELPLLAGMSDDEIRKRYPVRKKVMKKKRARTDCAVLQFRDDRWRCIEPIINFIEKTPGDAFETNELSLRILRRATELNRPKQEVYDAVHRVLAHAAGKQSLMPSHARCGSKGNTREPRNVARLGLTSKAFQKGEIPGPGIHPTESVKRLIAVGHSKFVAQGKSVSEAYLLTMGAWWSESSRIIDGVEVPVLKPAHERPSLSQFRYWGPRDPEGKSAYELLLRPNEWDLKYRSLLGSAMDGIKGVGQMAVLDATGVHVNFVSMTSFLNAIGPSHRIVVHEGLCELITGFYVGLEAPSERTALLAIYNSVIDKVELFGRFGVAITSEQVPPVFYRKFRGDNGELRNIGSMNTLTSLGSGLELVQRRRAERKPQAEAGHRSIQRLLDDKIDGATRGGPPDRGEDHSAIPACWTWFSYMREFLRAVVYFNCHADATSLMRRHPFRTEMARDQVPPKRAAMYAWCLRNNRIAIPSHDVNLLRVKLLPTFRATVKQTGIYLLRPDRGDKPEILRGPRYSGPRATELHWHDGKRRDFQIKVSMDPGSPNIIWFVDELGIHALDNLSSDELMKREATLDDLIAMQDEERVRKTVGQTEADQSGSDFVGHRENVNLMNRASKKSAIKAVGSKVSKTRLKSDISANRVAETENINRLIDPISRAPVSSVAEAVNFTEPPLSDPAKNPSASHGSPLLNQSVNLNKSGSGSSPGSRQCSSAEPDDLGSLASQLPGPPPRSQTSIVKSSLAEYRATRRKS